MSGVFEGAGTLNSLAAVIGAGLQEGFKMTRDEFVIEEVDATTILVRHLLGGVRFLFVMKGRRFAGADAYEPRPSVCEIKLAHLLCRRPAREAGSINSPPKH